MDSELLYLNKRVNYHRRMARQTAGEARCAHDAFVRAYRARIEELTRGGPSEGPEAGSDPALAPRPIPSPVLGR